MSIISLDGELSFDPYQDTSTTIHLAHKSRKSIIPFSPQTFSQKWKIPRTGYYTPADVTFVITPHISENAGVLANLRLVDSSDLSPSRVLYQSQQFNLGHGITLEGSQLPFCIPVGDYPIQFEVMVSQSPFRANRTMFTTSLEWRMMWSITPLLRVKSVFMTAQVPVKGAIQSGVNRVLKSKVASTPPKSKKVVQPKDVCGGTVPGLVSGKCVGHTSGGVETVSSRLM